MRTVPTLRDQSLKTYAASGPEQVRPDLAAFERIDEDALRKVCLAKVQRLPAQVVVASTRMSDAQSWTSSSCLPECKALKSDTPSTPRMTASPSTTNRFCRDAKLKRFKHGSYTCAFGNLRAS